MLLPRMRSPRNKNIDVLVAYHYENDGLYRHHLRAEMVKSITTSAQTEL